MGFGYGRQGLNWQFSAKITQKTILPSKEIGYLATFDNWWASEPLNATLSALLRSAAKSILIQTAGAAADSLRNQLDRGVALLNGSEPSEISFIKFWNDPTGQSDHLFGVSIGLSMQDLDAIRNDLDSAFYSGLALRITAHGGFSSVDPNPYSKQPTRDNFEAGFPLLLYDIGIRIEAQRA